MTDIIKVKVDNVEKYPRAHANAVIGLDDKIQSKINQNNSYIMFVETQQEWEALPQTEKAKYILRAVTE